MPLPYRTIFAFPANTDLVALAERQIQEWIETKRKVDPERRAGFVTGEYFEAGVHDLGSSNSLQVVRSDSDRDGTRRRLLRFTEKTKQGIWQVDIVAIDRHDTRRNGADTLVVDARRVDDPDAEGQVDPPHVVKQLLSEVAVMDGETPVTAQARLIEPPDLQLVLSSILDPNRTVSVIVAAAPDRNRETLENLRAVIDSLTAKVVGTASVFILNFDALLALNAELPPSHQLEPGRVRTYMPRVNLLDPADGWKHRVLGPLTLARAIRPGHRVDRRLQEAFALQTRGAQLKSPLARDLQRNWSVLTGDLAEILRNETVRAAVEEVREEQTPVATSPQRDTSLGVRLASFFRRILGAAPEAIDVAHVDALEREWTRVETAATAIRTDLSRYEQLLSESRETYGALYEEHEYRGLELADAEKRASALDAEVRWLRRELASLGSPSAYSSGDDKTWDTPNDLEELVLLLSPDVTDRPELVNRVVFVGDPKDVSGAQAQDATGLDAQRVWGFVRVLFDYAEARAAGSAPGNVHACLRSDAYDGFKVPDGRHAPVETEQTLNQWASQRTFEIPELGPTLMPAHFKSGKFVRLHYHDDTGPDGSGKVYIGYVGLHLPNTKTKNM